MCSVQWRNLLEMLRTWDFLHAYLLELWLVASCILSMFSVIRTILTLPFCFLLVAQTVVRNFSVSFLMVLWSETFLCLLTLLKCHLNIWLIMVTESLFSENAFRANACYTANYWFMLATWCQQSKSNEWLVLSLFWVWQNFVHLSIDQWALPTL